MGISLNDPQEKKKYIVSNTFNAFKNLKIIQDIEK